MYSPDNSRQRGESLGEFIGAPGTHMAVTVLLADVAAIAQHSGGFIGFLLLVVGIMAASYIVGRLLRGPLGRLMHSATQTRDAQAYSSYGGEPEPARQPSRLRVLARDERSGCP